MRSIQLAKRPHQDPEAGAATVRVPATGGELWQGQLHGRLVMINFPISYYGEVRVVPGAQGKALGGLEQSPLARRAVQGVCEALGRPPLLEVELLNPVPRGLGMASSTTEIAAAAFAAARAMGAEVGLARRLADAAVRELDTGNDANYVPGLHLVDPRSHERILSFPRIPSMRVLLVHTGGRLDTLAMDRALEREVCGLFASEVQESFERMLRGLTFGERDLIGQAATQSTLVYQHITPKPGLGEALKAASRFPGFLGMASGHSGTVLSLLARPGHDLASLRGAMAGIFGAEGIIGEFDLVSGGIHESTRIS